MFGYIRIQKGDLLVKEYETYKSVYCGLCRQMGKEYSFLSRFVLSYDCTFYAMMLLALNKSCSGFERKCCVCNPLKKCVYCKTDSDSLSKASALNIILSYFKLLDDINDSNFVKKIFLSVVRPLFSLWSKKAKKKYPDIYAEVKEMMKKQDIVENSEEYIFDEACHPTANMLGNILKTELKNDSDGRILYQMGYGLGRFIYLADAVDDYAKDKMSGNFNPFKIIEEDIYEVMKNNLSQSLAMTFDAYNLLELYDFKGITDNIILKGLPVVQEEILKKVKGEI